MKKIFFICFILIEIFSVRTSYSQSYYSLDDIKYLYNTLNLKDKLDYHIFYSSLMGYNKIKMKKEDYICIIDFSKLSNEKRFFLIDLENNKLYLNTYVAHGRKTGIVSATEFSNKIGSYKSSLGFYLGDIPYEGHNGLSLRLIGLEDNINSNACIRNVVIHGADYASKEFVKKYGFLGRSEGCPAVPYEDNKKIIDALKDGRVIFIYGDDKNYFNKSEYMFNGIIE